MAIEIQIQDEDRWQVMRVLFAEGKTFAEMLPVLGEHGLLECLKTHRKRRGRNGEEVCATCEDTIGRDWRRGLARLSETEAVANEVMGAWIEAHLFIAKTCRERTIQSVKITTTRTESIDGKDVATVTVREETRVNQGLLRLLSETQDKILRATGVDIDDPDALAHVPRSKVRVNRSTGTGAGRGDGAVN
jgi:hypothetical protein